MGWCMRTFWNVSMADKDVLRSGGRGLDHGAQSCLTFNELALVLLLVRRAVHCAVPPTAVKQRILWGQDGRNRERQGRETQSYFTLQTQVMDENPELSVFRQKLSQELDSILKDFLCTEYVVILSQWFLYTVHRWRRGGTEGNGRSSGYRKSLRENPSHPLKATCNVLMYKFFLCALSFFFFPLFLYCFLSSLLSSCLFTLHF